MSADLVHRYGVRPSVCPSRQAYTQDDSPGDSNDAASLRFRLAVRGPIHLSNESFGHFGVFGVRNCKSMVDFIAAKIPFIELLKNVNLFFFSFNVITITIYSAM